MRILVILCVIITPAICRAVTIEGSVVRMTGTKWLGLTEVLRNDLAIICGILVFLLIAGLSKRRLIMFGALVVACALTLVMIVDVLLYTQFVQRLTVIDVLKYGGYAVEYLLDFNVKFLAIIVFGVVFGALALVLVSRWLWKAEIDKKLGGIACIILVLVGATAALSRKTNYVNYRYYQNVFSYNYTVATEFKGYSDAFKDGLENPFEPVCTPQPKSTGPVIVYMVESLSSYHSAFFGGHNDWTPAFDAIAQNGVSFTNFFANGFTTEDGELSLISGELPIYPPQTYHPGGGTVFTGYWNPKETIATLINDSGRDTHFLTASDLAFSSTGAWMQAVGFDTVEGSESPFYEGAERFHFDAPSDEVLVNRVLNIVEESDNLGLLFVKTTSSHHPHIHPPPGERSEEMVMRFVDEQIDRLYDALVEKDFFADGHLIIVGDHRAMTPLTAGEIDKYGIVESYIRIPAVWLTDALDEEPRIVTDAYSQVDLSNTLVSMQTGSTCTTPIKGQLFGSAATPPEYIIHRRGDLRTQFSVFSGDRLGTVTLDGDNTRFSGADFTTEEQKSLVQYVNFARVRAADDVYGGEVGLGNRAGN